VFLLYGNRNEENIIFKSKLDEIEKKYEGQLEVQYILSQPTETKKVDYLEHSKNPSVIGRG